MVRVYFIFYNYIYLNYFYPTKQLTLTGGEVARDREGGEREGGREREGGERGEKKHCAF